MDIEIKLEKKLNKSKKIKIIKILKNIGDEITPDDILLQVEADKVNTPIKANAKGVLKVINVKEGTLVDPEDILAVIDGERVQKDTQDLQNTKNSTTSFSYFGNLIKPLKQDLSCDISIIGGGPGGYVAAIHAAKLGAKVILVEKDELGGTCLNYGCIPTKALVRSAQVYKTLKNADDFGCFADNVGFNMNKVIERKSKVVSQLCQGIKYLMDKHNITVVNGNGNIIDTETIFVKGSNQEITIKSKNIIIATGSKSSNLNIPGSELENVIDSNAALELKDLPNKMSIIGGGVIGMEFAYIFSNFGVDVTVIEYLDDCLTGCDDDICEEIKNNALNRNIKIYNGAKVEEITKTEDGYSIVSFVQNNTKKHVISDKVLMAVGRTPFIEGLGIENVNIELNENKKGIKVNSNMQTNIPNIYAIGDVTNKVLLAHVASHQGIIAVNNIMGKESEMDYNTIPGAIFTDPEIATVGLNEKEANAMGIEIEVGKFPFSANGKALTFGETEGFIKLIKDKKNGQIIGGSIIGLHATDLISEITLAIRNKLTAEDIIKTIHAHPTTAEVIHEAALSVEGGSIHFA